MAKTSLLNRFIGTFVLPLVAGGKLEVRGLLGPGVLADFVSDPQIDATTVLAITTQMRQHLARIGPVGNIDVLPSGVLGLAALWHNLLAMTHPDPASRLRLRRRVREWSELMIAWVGSPKTAQEVAQRHALLARLPDVGRVDTSVRFWAGKADYIGVSPPQRLLRWKKVRRVVETKTRVALHELFNALHSDDAAGNLLDLARASLALSPLTDIALSDRAGPMPFEWSPLTLNAIGDAALRGAAQRLVLARSPMQTAAQGDESSSVRVKNLEAATLRVVVAPEVPVAAAQMLLVFHLEMLVAEALARSAPPPANTHVLAWDALARLGAARASRIVGLPQDRVERALGLDLQPRAGVKDAPSTPLLQRAGFVEVTS